MDPDPHALIAEAERLDAEANAWLTEPGVYPRDWCRAARAVVPALSQALRTALAERDEARSDEEETIAQRDEREEQIEAIHACTGCEQEWSNLHDLGSCSIAWASSVEVTIQELREQEATLRSERDTALAEVEAMREVVESARAVESALVVCEWTIAFERSGHLGIALRALDARRKETT